MALLGGGGQQRIFYSLPEPALGGLEWVSQLSTSREEEEEEYRYQLWMVYRRNKRA